MSEAPPTPSPPPESAERRLLSITDAFACPICHATLRAPVLLPCEHMFCSECARRHLSSISACPQPFCKKSATMRDIIPLRAVDAALDAVRGTRRPAPPQNPHPPKMVFLSKKDPRAKVRFTQRLRENGLPTNGPVEVLAARDRDFVIRWNANLDAAVPRARRCIAREVIEEERQRERERRKAARNDGMAFFATKGGAPAGDVDPETPVEGDDFGELIRKLKARKGKLKRERGGDGGQAESPAAKVPKCQDLSQPGSASRGEGKREDGARGTSQASAAGGLVAESARVGFDYSAVPPPPSVPSSQSESSADGDHASGHSEALSRGESSTVVILDAEEQVTESIGAVPDAPVSATRAPSKGGSSTVIILDAEEQVTESVGAVPEAPVSFAKAPSKGASSEVVKLDAEEQVAENVGAVSEAPASSTNALSKGGSSTVMILDAEEQVAESVSAVPDAPVSSQSPCSHQGLTGNNTVCIQRDNIYPVAEDAATTTNPSISHMAPHVQRPGTSADLVQRLCTAQAEVGENIVNNATPTRTQTTSPGNLSSTVSPPSQNNVPRSAGKLTQSTNQTSPCLTEEQKLRIAYNRQKAIELQLKSRERRLLERMRQPNF